MPTVSVPDHGGGSLVNLVSEIEARMGGSPPNPALHPELASLIPEGEGYLFVLFDGLGSGQLRTGEAARLAPWHVADLDAPFPATTTVALATVATAMTPVQHGLIGYQMWMPQLDTVVNTIKWTTLWGAPLTFATETLLPAPNLWERLSAIGVETVTIQPAHFDRSPLTRALYRGCTFEGATGVAEIVERCTGRAGPGRVVFTYVPHVDFAAHVHGQHSPEYREAIAIAAAVWEGICAAAPSTVTVVGSADHGHIDFPPDRQHAISKPQHAGLTFYGDGRAMFVRGDGRHLEESLPATWVPIERARHWWGPGEPGPSFGERAPDGILLADDDALLLHRFSDTRMIGNHGAMVAAEQQIPLLVRA